jgi:hypothetical protein
MKVVREVGCAPLVHVITLDSLRKNSDGGEHLKV